MGGRAFPIGRLGRRGRDHARSMRPNAAKPPAASASLPRPASVAPSHVSRALSAAATAPARSPDANAVRAALICVAGVGALRAAPRLPPPPGVDARGGVCLGSFGPLVEQDSLLRADAPRPPEVVVGRVGPRL